MPQEARRETTRPVIAFDYDGTLVDTYAIKRESYWRAVSEVLGLEAERRPIVDEYTPHDASVAAQHGIPFYRVGGDADLARLPEVVP